MSYIILALSLLIVLLLIFSKSIFYKNYNQINLKIKKRMDAMLKLTRIVPVIVLLVISILALTYFKSKFDIRLSHAWLLLNFWICIIIFYYIIAEIAKIRKPVIILPAIGMMISLLITIYLTPLFHYESVFQNTKLIIPNLFGLAMIVASYYVSHALLAKETAK